MITNVLLYYAVASLARPTVTSSVVDHWLAPLSDQTKDYTLGICCFSGKYLVVRNKSKDWFAQNLDNVLGWGIMSTRGLLFRWASTINIQLSCIYKAVKISSKCELFSPGCSWTITECYTLITHWLDHRVGFWGNPVISTYKSDHIE